MCVDNGITMEMVSLVPGVTMGPTCIAGGVASDRPFPLFLLILIAYERDEFAEKTSGYYVSALKI